MSRRKFGQHFLVHRPTIRTIVEAANIARNNIVLEIGTGTGTLTRELARSAKLVLSYEIDKKLWTYAKYGLADLPNVKLFNKSFRYATQEFDILVTSLPFSESATFVTWLAQRRFIRAVAVLQKDFVRKIIAPVGSKMYRGVSVLAQISFKVDELLDIPLYHFQPPPKVMSEIVRLTPRVQALRSPHVKLLRLLFTFRGRTLRAFLKHQDLDSYKIKGDLLTRRVEQITPAEYQNIIARLDELDTSLQR